MPGTAPPMLRTGLLILLLAACTTDSTVLSPRCDLEIQAPAPSSALPGDEVTVQGTPLTSTYDTAVYVGSERATVLEVLRDDCETCDQCREDNECNECADCDICDATCAEDCVETVRFQVPATAPAGTAAVLVYNLHGMGGPVSLEVLGGDDTGGDDSGGKDSGGKDSGGTDSGKGG